MSEILENYVSEDPFLLYRQALPGGDVYSAGFPSYPANFSRDTFKAGIIAGHVGLLATQLEASACYQGVKDDPQTGETPGKIHHEVPGTTLPDRGDLLTTYNACDTTALFLIAAEGLTRLDKTKASSFLSRRRDNLKAATANILEGVGQDELFWEIPPKGSDGYALRVTYWKDSILPHPDGKHEPVYPVTYALAHFIAARGIQSAGHLLNRPDLNKKADAMFRAGIDKFLGEESFTVYHHRTEELKQPSSDELHSLAYIPARYAELLPLEGMRRRANDALATPFGYMCTPVNVAQHLDDKYHGARVWVFEQSLIHYGARKFGLGDEAKTAVSIADHVGAGQELFCVNRLNSGNITITPEGNERQLWSVAASEYFASRSSLSVNQWL